MTLMSAVNPNVANSRSQQEYPTLPESAEALEFNESGNGDGGGGNEARPYNPDQGRRAIVIVMGMVSALVALSIIGMAFMQGSWWYSYPADQALDRESRSRLEMVRDEVDAHEVDASGAVPQVVTWLDVALNSYTDPTAVRNYLLTAQESLKATGDPKLVEAARELQEIIQAIRPVPLWETTTPRPAPTFEWQQ